MVKKIRGVSFEENDNNAMGLSFYNLSHRFGYQSPNWPYFEDVKIERIQYMAKSGVLSQRITTSMHNTTHIDAPAPVVQGTPAGYSAYCASKSAVDGITKAIGRELGASGITVNALGLTVFHSLLTEWMFADDERGETVRAGFLTRVPKGRLGEPEDLVDPLPFLALEGLRLLHRLRSLRRRRLHGRLTVSTQRPATLLSEKGRRWARVGRRQRCRRVQ